MKRALLIGCVAICALMGLAAVSAAYATSPRQSDVGTGVVAPQQGTPTPTPCVASYACSVIPGATIVPGITDTGNHCDDCITNVTLPFPVQLYGVTYTSVNLSSNGNAQFVSTDPEFSNTCLPYAPMGPTIFAYWEDLVTDGPNCTGGCGIFTSVSGSAPNRIFNIEWRTFYFSEPGNAYFEIRLYEGTANFDIILGQVNTQATATIGLQSGGAIFTQCICNTAPPTNSRIVFIASICGTATPTATPMNTSTPASTASPTYRPCTPTPTGTPAPSPGPCSLILSTLFRETFNSGSLGTFISTVVLTNTGGWTTALYRIDCAGPDYRAFAPDVDSVSDQRLTLRTPFAVPSNAVDVYLTFDYIRGFEERGGLYYDGGCLSSRPTVVCPGLMQTLTWLGATMVKSRVRARRAKASRRPSATAREHGSVQVLSYGTVAPICARSEGRICFSGSGLGQIA
jgi:hypothetical protein